MYSDGGGVVTAARKPIYGADKIARFMVGVQRKSALPRRPRLHPGARSTAIPACGWTAPRDGFLSIIAIEVADGAIQAVRFFTNPERFPAEFPRA